VIVTTVTVTRLNADGYYEVQREASRHSVGRRTAAGLVQEQR